MNRNTKLSQMFGQVYVIFVFSFIFFMYYDIYRIFSPSCKFGDAYIINFDSSSSQVKKSFLSNIYFIGFNILIGLLTWSLIKSIISDPGKIPRFWVSTAHPISIHENHFCLFLRRGASWMILNIRNADTV